MSRRRIGALALAGVVVLAGAVEARSADMIDDALRAAARAFERASSDLDSVVMGVPVAEYRDALRQLRFRSSRWGATLAVRIVAADNAGGLCGGFAAYVTPAIEEGAVILTVCPQFFSPGADDLRETTILHEMVHVVAGPDECRAMAYTARVQVLARGTHVPVGGYWKRNNCEASRYSLPD